jgi:hypothetical protein
MPLKINHLENNPDCLRKRKQKESGRRSLLLALCAICCAVPANAQNALDAGGLTFKDFAVEDRGASFYRGDPTVPNGQGPASAQVLSIDNNKGLARIRFGSIKVDVAVPMGWQASDDPERGVSYSADKSYRLIVWRVDFAFEGVKDAEQYAARKGGVIKSRFPSVQSQARKLGDGSFLIAYEDVPPGQGDREKRTVFDIITPSPSNPKEGVLMTLGVPASQADRGLKLLALLRQNIQITW